MIIGTEPFGPGRLQFRWLKRPTNSCLCALLVLGISACRSEPDTPAAADVGQSQQAATAEVCRAPVGPGGTCLEYGGRIGTALPPGASADDVALLASETLSLGSAAEIRGAVANMGSGITTLGSSARTDDIWSKAFVSIGSNAHVEGSVTTASTALLAPGAVITGSLTENSEVKPDDTVSWLANFPKTNQGDVTVSTAMELAPGNYGIVRIQAGGILTLRAGISTFEALHVEAGGRVLMAAKDRPVVIHIRNAFTYAGTFERTSDANRGVLVSYLGEGDVVLEQPFRGTFAAPFALVKVAYTTEPHRGAFFAKNIQLAAGAAVEHEPFGSWKELSELDEERNPLPPPAHTETNGPPPPLVGAGDVTTRVRAFVDWYVNSRVNDLPAAREAADAAEGNNTIAGALAAEFERVRDSDPTRADLTLQTLGYLRSSSGETFLTALVNEPLPTSGTPTHDGQILERVLLERYQRVAVHSLAFMHTTTADMELRRLMHAHESPLIRAQAVRAFIFHNAETDPATLLPHLRPDEHILIDRFENRNVWGDTTFDERLQAYLAKHPVEEETP